MSRDLTEVLKVVREASRTSCLAAARYGASYQSVMVRIVRLFLRERFAPRESFLRGLANPRVSASEIAQYVSKRRLLKIQARYNSRSRECLTEDKSVFYPICIGLGLPVPTLHAVITPPFGWWEDGSHLSNRSEWEELFRERLVREFVVKPAGGVHGRGVRVFKRVEERFEEHSGATSNERELYDSVSSDPIDRTFVIQEMVRNHPELVKLSGTDALQTLRMVTFVSKERGPEIVFATLRIIAGEKVTDNFASGRSGNLVAEIGLEAGSVKVVACSGDDGLGLKTIPNHPKTGHLFAGFQLPFWAEACALVKEAALRFMPAGTIGWDVALTPSGPCIVEANMWWDPPTIPQTNHLVNQFFKARR